MSKTRVKIPFQWSRALAACFAGAAVGAIGVWVGMMGQAPWTGYAAAGSFGAVFAFVLYLGRNAANRNQPFNSVDGCDGDLSDYALGVGSSTWGLMGHAAKSHEDMLEASHRSDP